MSNDEQVIIEDEVRARFQTLMKRMVGREKRFRYKANFIEFIGWRRQTLNKIEAGSHSITVPMARELHNKLRVNMNWLIAGKGNMYV